MESGPVLVFIAVVEKTHTFCDFCQCYPRSAIELIQSAGFNQAESRHTLLILTQACLFKF